MVTNEQTKHYRQKVSRLLSQLRSSIFYQSGSVSYPTDSSVAFLLGISPTALSSINRQCASMSGITLLTLLRELSKRVDSDYFISVVRGFVDDESCIH